MSYNYISTQCAVNTIQIKSNKLYMHSLRAAYVQTVLRRKQLYILIMFLACLLSAKLSSVSAKLSRVGKAGRLYVKKCVVFFPSKYSPTYF